MAEEAFDYVVVGAGAAGAIVAARLSEAPNIRVLLLEVGPDDRSIYIRTAGGYFKVLGMKRTFLFETEAEPALNGRKLPLVQGRTLGGGTSVNAMCYLRGQREDYDDWKSAGCAGWGWDDVLPYFKKSEANIRLSGPHHGVGGPMPVSDGEYRQELCQAFVRAAQEAKLPSGRGIEYNHDFNGDRQEGVGFYQTMSLHGERASTARTFLREAVGRKNLDVRVESAVTRLVVKDGRATGVVVRDKSRREYNGGLFGQDRGWNMICNGLQWLWFRTGVLASNVVEAGGFFDFTGEGRPQIQFNAYGASSTGWGDPIVADHRVSFAPFLLTCHSRGRVQLRSRNPDDNPKVHANLLSDERDVAPLVAGVRLARQILRAPSLERYVKEETLPGAGIGDDVASIEGYIRERAKTGLHPVGTCAMAPGDGGVDDLQLKLKAIEGVRIIDGSVMPTIVRGNTTAPIMMIAERGADLIRKAG